MTFNSITLAGRLTGDFQEAKGDGPGVFRMAVDNPFSKKKEVLFIDIKIWSEGLNKACKLMAKKGCQVLVEGRLTDREYEKEEYPGAKFHYASVSANVVQFGDKKPAVEGEGEEEEVDQDGKKKVKF